MTTRHAAEEPASPVVPPSASPVPPYPCLPGTGIEIIRDDVPRGRIRFALFDFDGTISVIREGWQGVMIPFMVEELMATPRAESAEGIEAVVREYVERLTGKQTIYQMIELAEEVRKRGGQPKEPLEYKGIYHDRLWQRIAHRVAGLKDGSIAPDDMMILGARAFLQALRDRDVTLYLASGTDIGYVRDEAEALRVTGFFNGGIYGAVARFQDFSKQKVIDQILREHNLHGSELMVVGDGYVEIENCKGAGGIAVGVASYEPERGGLDAWKRNRLISAGADVIITDFREADALLEYLF